MERNKTNLPITVKVLRFRSIRSFWTPKLLKKKEYYVNTFNNIKKKQHKIKTPPTNK